MPARTRLGGCPPRVNNVGVGVGVIINQPSAALGMWCYLCRGDLDVFDRVRTELLTRHGLLLRLGLGLGLGLGFGLGLGLGLG